MTSVHLLLVPIGPNLRLLPRLCVATSDAICRAVLHLATVLLYDTDVLQLTSQVVRQAPQETGNYYQSIRMWSQIAQLI